MDRVCSLQKAVRQKFMLFMLWIFIANHECQGNLLRGCNNIIYLKGKIRSCKYRFCTNEISGCTIKFIYSSSIHFWVHLNFPILLVGLLYVSCLSLLVDVLLDSNTAKWTVFLASKTGRLVALWRNALVWSSGPSYQSRWWARVDSDNAGVGWSHWFWQNRSLHQGKGAQYPVSEIFGVVTNRSQCSLFVGTVSNANDSVAWEMTLNFSVVWMGVDIIAQFLGCTCNCWLLTMQFAT